MTKKSVRRIAKDNPPKASVTPSDAEKENTVKALKTIIDILKNGLYQGVNVVVVADSIKWLEQTATMILPSPQKLEAVPDVKTP